MAEFRPISGRRAKPAFRLVGRKTKDPTARAQATENLPEPESTPTELAAAAFEEGKQEALVELRRDMERARGLERAAVDLIEKLQVARKDALASAAQELGDIVLAVTRRIVATAVQQHPETVTRIAREALEALPDDQVRLRCRPEDAEHLQAVANRSEGVEIVPDPLIQGGLVLETRHASIDATLDGILGEVENAVKHWLEDE